MTVAYRCLCCTLMMAAAGAAPAASSDSSASQSVTPSAGDAVKEGDNIYFTSYAAIFRLVPGPSTTGGAQLAAPASPAAIPTTFACVPVKYRFVVQSITPASTTSSATKDSQVKDTQLANTSVVMGYFPGGRHLLHWTNKPPPDQGSSHPGCQGQAWVETDTSYQFTSDDLKKAASQREGFTWGAMVIPYKFYFTDKSIKGNPSTVAYAGYEGWFPGISLAFVGSAGIGVAPSSSTSSSSTTQTGGTGATTPSTSGNSNSTAVTYTIGTGVIATFGGAIKGGVMFGRDYQGSGAGFKYENKTWMALSVGTSF